MKRKLCLALFLFLFSFVFLSNLHQVSAATFISNCANLNQAGETYYLTANLINSAPSTCMNINANNITLDCQGHTIDGLDTLGYGINISRGYPPINTNITIRNCIVTDWIYGIYLKSARNNTLSNNIANSNDGGIFLTSGSNNILSNNIANSNFYSGIQLYSNNNTLTNNTANSNQYGISLSSSFNNIITNNTANDNLVGIRLDSSYSNTLINNTANSGGNCLGGWDGFGIYLITSSNNTLKSNSIQSCHTPFVKQQGLYVYGEAISDFRNNIDESNKINGLPIYYIDGINRPCINNTVYTNGSKYGYMGFVGCRNITVQYSSPTDHIVLAGTTNSKLSGLNISYTRMSIFLAAGANNNILANNTANGNRDWGIGLYSSYSNNLTNNTANSHFNHGIMLYSSYSNTLTNNTANNDNSFGIYLYSSYSNNITGGSIHSNGFDYSLSNASTDNKFTDTNFTAARKIYFYDATSWFNYNNQTILGIWLKTNVFSPATITRNLVKWSYTNMSWNEVASTSVTANYTLTGLVPSRNYTIYSIFGSKRILNYTRSTDANGVLIFNMSLNTTTRRIMVNTSMGGGTGFAIGKDITPFLPNIYYVGDTINSVMDVGNPMYDSINFVNRSWDTLPNGTVIEFLDPGEILVQQPGAQNVFYANYTADVDDLIWRSSPGVWVVNNTFEVTGTTDSGGRFYGLVSSSSRIIRPSAEVFIGTPLMSATPIFTGDVPTDFTGPGILIIPDQIGDIGLPPNAPLGTISGWDIEDLRLTYNATTDTLYVGINTFGIAGDVDGDGDPGRTSAWLAENGFADRANLSMDETILVAFDLNQDGTYDVIAGDPGLSNITNFTVAEYVGEIWVPGIWDFGTPLPTHNGGYYANPSAADPDFEFTILNFSKLPGQDDKLDGFRVGVLMGSGADGVGENILIYEQIPSVTHCVPAGDTTNLAITEQNNGYDSLTNVSVTVNNGTSVIAVLDNNTPGMTGDYSLYSMLPNGILERGENWRWNITGVVIYDTTTFTATGYGIDPLNNSVTYPKYQGQRKVSSIEKCPGVVINQLCSPNDDFTGTCQNVALSGGPSYLNVKWSASYEDNVERNIGVDCYLNCPDPGDNITEKCKDYKTSTNYCSYKALTGYGSCTIVNPNYLFGGQANNVTCSFYNPAYQYIQYLPYPNRTFKPIDFDVYSALNGSVTVGKPFALLVNVRNFGLFVGNFTSNTSALVKPQLVSIENPIGLIENLKYNGIGEIYSKVTFLSAEKINLKVLVKSNLDPTPCSGSGDCSSYLGSGAECIKSKCWKRITVEINSGMSSLPEFNWTGLLQIIIISTVVVFFSKRKL